MPREAVRLIGNAVRSCLGSCLRVLIWWFYAEFSILRKLLPLEESLNSIVFLRVCSVLWYRVYGVHTTLHVRRMACNTSSPHNAITKGAKLILVPWGKKNSAELTCRKRDFTARESLLAESAFKDQGYTCLAWRTSCQLDRV